VGRLTSSVPSATLPVVARNLLGRHGLGCFAQDMNGGLIDSHVAPHGVRGSLAGADSIRAVAPVLSA
jgi:hypothetical protein